MGIPHGWTSRTTPSYRPGQSTEVRAGPRPACARPGGVPGYRRVRFPAMQEILEAIQAGASGDEIAALPIPESYRAAHVLRAEQDMWEGVPSEDKDPRKSLHIGDVPTPELAPDEVYLAVMASSINFNTVWTSIFEPMPDVRLPRPAGPRVGVGRPPRHRLPRRRVRRLGRRAAGGVGRAQLEAGRPGGRALQLRRRPGPVRPRRLDARRQPAHLGLRVQLRRPGRPVGGQGQPAHAQAHPPHAGRSRRSTACAPRPATACWSAGTRPA